MNFMKAHLWALSAAGLPSLGLSASTSVLAAPLPASPMTSGLGFPTLTRSHPWCVQAKRGQETGKEGLCQQSAQFVGI